MMDERNEDGETKHDHNGIWIGIDLGTSNSACAVWDSSRGSSKWCVTLVPRQSRPAPSQSLRIDHFSDL